MDDDGFETIYKLAHCGDAKIGKANDDGEENTSKHLKDGCGVSITLDGDCIATVKTHIVDDDSGGGRSTRKLTEHVDERTIGIQACAEDENDFPSNYRIVNSEGNADDETIYSGTDEDYENYSNGDTERRCVQLRNIEETTESDPAEESDHSSNSTAPTLTLLKAGLKSMEMKMEKTVEIVRGVAMQLKGQGIILQKLNKRMNQMEQKEVSSLPSFHTNYVTTPLNSSFPSSPIYNNSRSPRTVRACRHSFRSMPRAETAVKTPPANFAERLECLGRNLLYESITGNSKNVRKLLDSGANPNFQGAGRWTALHRAAEMAHTGVVQLLVGRGANINAMNCQGSTALHIAAENDATGRCVELLVIAGADLGIRNRFGRTPLHYAAEHGCIRSVYWLVSAGANRKAKDYKGRTPKDVARTTVVRRLLRMGSGSRRTYYSQ